MPKLAEGQELLTMKRILQSSLQSFWAKRGKRLKIKDGWELFWKEADEEKYGRLNFQQLEENLRALLMKHSDSLLSPRTALNSARASMPHADETRDPVLKGITREDLRVLFAEADLDGSGEVSATEWSSMLYRLELSTWPTADEVNVPRAVATINRAAAKWYRAGDNWFKVFRLADQNSGRIDFNDFQGMVRQRTPGLGINKKKVSDQEPAPFK
ncbi:unnamed protein product [Effrenium voratum]|uniref:EF-hand domain-containing protein n=1 Tax=Effrenium voratum TaxID=2562239 RepID=A0AA36NN59_9DINO|nr:unnamed protein product [Effrenium voratum]